MELNRELVGQIPHTEYPPLFLGSRVTPFALSSFPEQIQEETTRLFWFIQISPADRLGRFELVTTKLTR